jgi:hypothetical protein
MAGTLSGVASSSPAAGPAVSTLAVNGMQVDLS